MHRIALLLLALVPTLAVAQGSPLLASLRDKNRVLLVFAASDQDPDFKRQIDLLSTQGDALRQRDLKVVPVATIRTQPPDTDAEAFPNLSVSQAEQSEFRLRFHVSPKQFTVILIGKDGGEKMRQQSPIAIDKLSALIDAMPMRRDEMRQQKH